MRKQDGIAAFKMVIPCPNGRSRLKLNNDILGFKGRNPHGYYQPRTLKIPIKLIRHFNQCRNIPSRMGHLVLHKSRREVDLLGGLGLLPIALRR